MSMLQDNQEVKYQNKYADMWFRKVLAVLRLTGMQKSGENQPPRPQWSGSNERL